MQTLLKTKIGPFLVVSSVLALWTLLAAQPGVAHEGTSERLATPSCSNLPGAAFFRDAQTTAIDDDGGLTHTSRATKQGGSVSGRGDSKYRYARITIPPLAAGELRVFDETTTMSLSDAVLCGASSTVSSITSYRAHDAAHTAAASAHDGDTTTTTDDAAKAEAAADAATMALTALGSDYPSLSGTSTSGGSTTDFGMARSALDTARSALNTARSALNTARSDLGSAARALNAASISSPGDDAETEAENAVDAEQEALTIYTDNPLPSLPSSVSASATEDQKAAAAIAYDGVRDTLRDRLTAVRDALNTTPVNPPVDAYNALMAASTALTAAANAMHTGFRLRAPVVPGDEEYIVVVASRNPTADFALNIAFHGAIDSTAEAATDGTFTASQSLEDTLSSGEEAPHTITVTAPGLLTLETTGSTDTVGTLYVYANDAIGAEVAQAESGGSGDNFKIVVPVIDRVYRLILSGTAGDYTLDMDFKVAMSTVNSADGTMTPTTWPTNMDLPGDDTTQQIQKVNEASADEDYFLLTVGDDSGLLTVNANDDGTSAADSNTSGTLFGAMETGPMEEMRTGEIATDSDSGPGSHFKFTVPVRAGKNYLVKVTGTDGRYRLDVAFAEITDGDANTMDDPISPPVDPISGTLASSTTGQPQARNLYLLNITESGALYLHTTGTTTDVVGTLYGPDGKQIAMDSDSGTGDNFRIATNVEAGLYLLEVKGANRAEAGSYDLVTNFVTGDVVTTPTTPGTGTGTEVTDLQAEIDELKADLAACEEPIETDARGALGNPSGGGFRSGIGIISGWVCAAKEVEVRISRGGVVRLTLDVAYGTSRPDTVGECDHNSPNTGFGMTYNFNHLPEGVHTIRAYADDELVGQEQTFEVVHLRPFAANDDNRFLTGLPDGECRVDDFPAAGEDTFLKWEQSTQNFVIEDAG